MGLTDTLLSTIVVVIWGVNFIVIKLGTAELPPFLLTALRFTLVALLVVPFRPLPRAIKPKAFWLGVVLGIGHFGLLFTGIRGLDTASAAITIQLGVPFSALAGVFLYKERLGWRLLLGLAMAFAGVALLTGEPSHPSIPYLLIVIAAAIAWAVSNVILKNIGPVDSLALNGWMALFATPLLLGMSLILENGQLQAVTQAGWAGWGAVAYTACAASLIAYTLWYQLVARLPISVVSPFTLLAPVISVSCATFILDEPLGWHKLVGGALTVAGVAFVQLRRKPSP